MKTVRVLFAVVSLSVLSLAGCGKNAAVKAAEDMADNVCKCKDVACAQAAALKGAEELQKHANDTGTESDAKAILKAGEKMSDCMTKLSTAEAPK